MEGQADNKIENKKTKGTVSGTHVFAFILGAAISVMLSTTVLGKGKDSQDFWLTRRSGPRKEAPLILFGRALLNSNGEELELRAIERDGIVRGKATDGLSGPVVELVAPTAENSHWCANIAIDLPELSGFNFLWYIRDVGNGRTSFDEVGASGGFGLTCASHPAPTSDDTQFALVVSGDFKAPTLNKDK